MMAHDILEDWDDWDDWDDLDEEENLGNLQTNAHHVPHVHTHFRRNINPINDFNDTCLGRPLALQRMDLATSTSALASS